MAEAPVAILEEPDGDLFGAQVHVHRFEDHLGGVLPGLGAQIHPPERCLGDAAHAAVDVGEATAEDDVQDRGRHRRSEVAVERRHRPRLDEAGETRAHDELGAPPELLDERPKLAEVVGAVGVAHDHIAAADEGERIDVGAPEAPLGRAQHARAAGQRQLGRAVAAAVDDQDLPDHAGLLHPLVAPGDEVGDGQLFVQRRDDDRQLRLRDVVGREQELDVGIDGRGGHQVDGGRRRRAHIRPAFTSGIIASIDLRSASRVELSQRHPRPRIRVVSRRTIGTSPFQPRSPPV